MLRIVDGDVCLPGPAGRWPLRSAFSPLCGCHTLTPPMTGSPKAGHRLPRSKAHAYPTCRTPHSDTRKVVT